MKLVIALFACLLSSSALAGTAGEGFFFAPTIYYSDVEYKENSSETNQTRTDLDMSVGYSFGNLMLGAKYYQSEIDTGDNEANTSAIGAVVGFEHKGFKLLGSYNFLNVTRIIDEPDTEYSDGTGTIIEIMYIVEFGTWGLGPKLFYKNFEYDKQELAGTEVDGFEGREETEIYPFLAFYFKI